jgi:hypothetical protein
MNDSQFERLLYEEESPTLDFKREQYPFAKASEEEKFELSRTSLGWRTLGVALRPTFSSELRTFAAAAQSFTASRPQHLADHSLQQFVNNLTNRPVRFGYEAFGFEGKQVGRRGGPGPQGPAVYRFRRRGGAGDA